ncbi:MAG: hypothetical protein ABEJ99_00740 [Candidatus Nanohaloarchaea archaeon]
MNDKIASAAKDFGISLFGGVAGASVYAYFLGKIDAIALAVTVFFVWGFAAVSC